MHAIVCWGRAGVQTTRRASGLHSLHAACLQTVGILVGDRCQAGTPLVLIDEADGGAQHIEVTLDLGHTADERQVQRAGDCAPLVL